MATFRGNHIRLKGMDKIIEAFRKAPLEIARSIKGAGEESAAEILDTQGLRLYPPATSANLPPVPYYVRGRGTQYATKNAHNSERYGSKWTVKTRGTGTTISNTASYAHFLAGSYDQSATIARIGWRKLIDVAREKIGRIRDIYSKWTERALRKAGL